MPDTTLTTTATTSQSSLSGNPMPLFYTTGATVAVLVLFVGYVLLKLPERLPPSRVKAKKKPEKKKKAKEEPEEEENVDEEKSDEDNEQADEKKEESEKD